MKKQIVKSLFAFAMVAAMTVTSAEAAFAAAPADTATGAGMKLQGTDGWEDFSTSASGYVESTGTNSISINYYGYGRHFKVYINGKLESNTPGDYDSNYSYDADDNETYTYSASYTDSYKTFTDLKPGTKYTIKVVATDADDKDGSSWSTTVTTDKVTINYLNIYTETSSTEIDRTAYSGMTKFANINWSSNYSSSIDKYEVYRSTNAKSGFTKLATLNRDEDGYLTSSYDDKTVQNGKTYYYKVRALSGSTVLADSPVEKIEFEVNKARFELTVNKSGQPVLVFFNGSNYNSAEFVVYRSTQQNKGFKKIGTTTDSSYTDSSAKTGKTYYYKVLPYYFNASKKKVAGTSSDPVGIELTMPGNMEFTAKPVSTKKVALSWKKLSGAAGYDVYMSTGLSNDGYKLVKSLTSKKKTKLTVKGLKADHNYYFLVQAYKKNKKKVKTYYRSDGDYASTGLVYPDAHVTSRTFSSDAAKKTITIKNTIKWDKMVGISGYRIYAYTDDFDESKLIKTLKGSATSLTYTQKLTAENNDGTTIRIEAYKGKNSEYDTISLYGNIAPAKGLSVKKASVVKDEKGQVIKGAKNGVTVSWKPAVGATSYLVTRSTPNGSEKEISYSTTKTSVQDYGLVKGVKYIYTVSAYNSNIEASSDTSIYHGLDYVSPEVYGTKELNANQVYFTYATATTKVTKAANKKGKKAVVSWKKVSGATGYVVYRSTKKKSGYTKVATVGAKITSYTDKKLTKKKTYYYKVAVESKNELGLTVTSGLSNFKAVKIKK